MASSVYTILLIQFYNHLKVWTAAQFLENGVVEQFNREKLTIGVDWNTNLPPEVERARLEEFAQLLRAGKGTCEVKEDIQSERWIKLVW